jgi:hypothetical protein
MPLDPMPVRPDEAPAQRVRERRWVPTMIVAALILIIAQGARTVADATAGATGPPITVGSVLTVQPRPGWDVVSTTAVPPAARLHRGPVLLDVFVYPAASDGPGGVAARYVEGALRPGLAQVTIGEAAPTTLTGGVPAVRFGYVGVTHDGVPLEGVVIAASGSSASAVFDAYAPRGELATVAGDLQAMIDGAEVR